MASDNLNVHAIVALLHLHIKANEITSDLCSFLKK